jgi:hypothetical protein
MTTEAMSLYATVRILNGGSCGEMLSEIILSDDDCPIGIFSDCRRDIVLMLPYDWILRTV